MSCTLVGNTMTGQTSGGGAGLDTAGLYLDRPNTGGLYISGSNIGVLGLDTGVLYLDGPNMGGLYIDGSNISGLTGSIYALFAPIKHTGFPGA